MLNLFRRLIDSKQEAQPVFIPVVPTHPFDLQDLSIPVLDHGVITLTNLAGPVRRPGEIFDAADCDVPRTARQSFGKGQQEFTPSQDEKLYRYLMKNKHTTPIEMIETWWEMTLPIMVARQFVRHRTAAIDEVSARYTELPDDWYIPELGNIRFKAEFVKQGGTLIDVNDSEQVGLAARFITDLQSHSFEGYTYYQTHLQAGIAPELARLFLGVNIYTAWVYKMDLKNLMHFLGLRLDSHAQLEARLLSEAMYQLMQRYLPVSMKLFEEFYLQSK